MKRFILILLCFIFCKTISIAQSPFTNVYTEWNTFIQAESVVETYDGNFLVAGIYGQLSGMIFKLDQNGNLLWQKSYTIGSPGLTEFYKIVATSDSAFLVLGNTFTSTISSTGALCMKIDINGDIIWTKAIVQPGYFLFAKDAEETSNGYIVTGFSNFGSTVVSKILVFNLDFSGNLMNSNLYQVGSGENISYEINLLNDSVALVTAQIEDSIPGDTYAVLMKLNIFNGSIVDAKKYKYNSAPNYLTGNEIIIKTNKIFLLINSVQPTLLSLDSLLTIEWAKTYDFNLGNGCINCLNYRLIECADNKMGFSSYNMMALGGSLTKIDSSGNIIFSQQMINSVNQGISLSDNTFLLIGNGPLIGVRTSSFLSQIGIIKTDTVGNALFCSMPVQVNVINDTVNVLAASITSSPIGDTISVSPLINSFTLNYSSNCVDISDIPEIFNENFIVSYPNPSTDYIYFECKEQPIKNASLSIYNLFGELIYKVNFDSSEKNKININNFANGYYLWEVRYDENVHRGKFIKQ